MLNDILTEMGIQTAFDKNKGADFKKMFTQVVENGSIYIFDNTNAVEKINSWVKDKTNGRCYS
jgi:serine protease inhibitor